MSTLKVNNFNCILGIRVKSEALPPTLLRLPIQMISAKGQAFGTFDYNGIYIKITNPFIASIPVVLLEFLKQNQEKYKFNIIFKIFTLFNFNWF